MLSCVCARVCVCVCSVRCWRWRWFSATVSQAEAHQDRVFSVTVDAARGSVRQEPLCCRTRTKRPRSFAESYWNTGLSHSLSHHLPIISCVYYYWLENLTIRATLTLKARLRPCRSFGCVLLLNQIYLVHNVPFDNTTPIYLINLPWKLGLGLGLDLKMHFF